MNKKKFMKIFFPVLGATVLVAGVYWSAIEFILKDYRNIGVIQFRYIVDADGNSEGTPAYITGIKEEGYPEVFELPKKLLGHPIVGIDAEAFKNLPKLKKVILPKTVEEIGDEAFANCPLLTDVVVNGELKSVGNEIFKNSGWLNAHSDEEFITFGNFLYKYNGNNTGDFILKSIKDKKDGENESGYVYIPTEINHLASGAFSNQPHLVEVEMPEEYTVIERNVFMNCSKLEKVDLKNVTSIQTGAFSGCTNLASIDLKDITVIGNGAFKGTALEEVTLNENITVINQSVFENCTKLSSIYIPESVTSIGNDAFAGDISLKSLNLTDNVKTIGNRVFKNSGIEEFVFPKYVDTINNELFAEAKSLTKVVLPSIAEDNTGILAIGNSAFKNASNLTSIEFPKDSNGEETVKTIGSSAFEGSGLKSITIPKTVTSLSDAVFKNCVDLEEVNFYDDSQLITINAECFSGTTSLNRIEFPNSVDVFFSAILSNSGVSEVILPNNNFKFTTLNKSFFENCVNLTSIVIPESVTTIDANVFKGCTNLTSITFGGQVRNISEGTFEDASSLSSIVIPNSVKTIDKNAFKNCTSLVSITISKSVNSIKEDAFLNAESLENVYYEGTIEDWNKIVFANEYSNPMYYAKHFFVIDENYEDGQDEANKWVELTPIELA